MILRRLSLSLKEQNWIAIWIEFILLVAGVFLGIQVANWNAAQQDYKREAEFISRLDKDFKKIEVRIAENISTWKLKKSASLNLLADLEHFEKTGRWPRSKAEMAESFDTLFSNRIPAQRSATYTEMLSAGQLGLIRNTRLRDALLDYDAQYNFTMTGFEILIERVEPLTLKLQRHLGNNLTKAAANIPIGGDDGFKWVDVDLDSLAADPEARTMILMYTETAFNHLVLAELQQSKALAVIEVLKSNLPSKENKRP